MTWPTSSGCGERRDGADHAQDRDDDEHALVLEEERQRAAGRSRAGRLRRSGRGRACGARERWWWTRWIPSFVAREEGIYLRPYFL